METNVPTLFRRYAGALLCAAAALCVAGPAAAAWPDHSVRIIVPSTPGGALDVLARIFGKELSEMWGQPVVVDNRAGAGGIIGTGVVANAAPDGYTLLIVTTGFATNPYLYKSLPYRTPQDFTPITILGISPNMLVANPGLPVHTLQELVALAKKEPGKLNYASSGVGSGGYLSMELLKQQAGIDIVHVPYSGAGAATTAAVSGQTQLLFTAVGAVISQIKSGQLRALAVSSSQRSQALPDVPTVAESGYPAYRSDGWYGILGPAKMPPAVVDKLYRDIKTVLDKPDIKQKMATLGFDESGIAPKEFSAYLDNELKTWKGVIEKTGAAGSESMK
jgi:tripartite-type tricarboxylate transporter receptor subunit TctC